MSGQLLNELEEYIKALLIERSLIEQRLGYATALQSALRTNKAPAAQPALTLVATFECEECGRTFPKAQGLSMHKTRTHPAEHRPVDHQAARDAAAAAI